MLGTPKEPEAIAADGASILNAQIKSVLVEGGPLNKVIGGVDYSLGHWNNALNGTLFGTTRFQDLANGGAVRNNIKQVFAPAIVTDLKIGYEFSKHISASCTVNNLFNVLPSWSLELTGSPGDPNHNAAKATL